MAKNCLLTQLKAVVNDDTLPILVEGDTYQALVTSVDDENVVYLGALGALEVMVIGATIKGVYPANTSVYTVSGNKVTCSGEAPLNSGFTINESDVPYVTLVVKSGMDNIGNVRPRQIETDIISDHVKDLTFSVEKDGTYNYYNGVVNLSTLDMSRFDSLSIFRAVYPTATSPSLISGNVSAFSALPNKNLFTLLQLIGNVDIVGSLYEFVPFININNLSLSVTGITGDWVEFVRRQKAAPYNRTEGNIFISSDHANSVTFNGVDMDVTYSTYKMQGKRIIWETTGETTTVSLVLNSDTSTVIASTTL